MYEPTRGRIGPLKILVTGRGGLAASLVDEMELDDDITRFDLEVRVGRLSETAPHYAPTIYSAKRHTSFNSTAFYADEPVQYVAERLFFGDSPAILAIDDSTEQPVAAWRRRLGRTINASPAMSYALFWFAIHVMLLRHRATFVHAGAFTHGDRAFAIAGTGGSGKTSILFDILNDPATAYLAEDFAILDRDGSLHFSPKSISVYSSDLHAGNLDIQRHLRARPVWDRVKWSIHEHVAHTTPMIKAPVRSLVQQVGSARPIAGAAYLVRTADDTVRVERSTTEEFVARLVDVAWREQKRLLEVLRLIRANSDLSMQYPTVDQLTHDMRSVLKAGLASADLWIVRVPARAEPPDILAGLRSAASFP